MLTHTIWAVQLILASVWVDSRDFEQGVSLPEPDRYSVWVWTRKDNLNTERSISIGGNRFDYSVHSNHEDEFVWVRAGRRDFMEGQYKIESNDNVATVVISTDDRYHPSKALPDRRIFDTPRGVRDQRVKHAHHTDTVFTMPDFNSKAKWEVSADEIRQRILLGSGLWPMPEKKPLNAKVFGKIIEDGYTIEKVHFEAWPGFLVTGNLYRPDAPGPHPAILMPHGHWEHGRLENSDTGSVPARAITFAKLGAICFTYDMVGYNDSVQLPHRWSQRSEKIWGIHPFAIQLWSSIRAIDFLQELPDVDDNRIGCTGASGGGTQTFAITAIDPRIKVAAPVNMISSTMQGGCVCENAPALRLFNSNMEIGALAAPRPMLMVSATGDWTRETPRLEYPAIRSIYSLYDADERISHRQVDASHNYNVTSRNAVYQFMGKWLLERDDLDTFTEPEYVMPNEKQMRVFPELANDGEKQKNDIITGIIHHRRDNRKYLLKRLNKFTDEEVKLWSNSLAGLTGAGLPEINNLTGERVCMIERDSYVLERWIIGRRGIGDAIPALFYRGIDSKPQDSVLIVHGKGKSSLSSNVDSGPGKLVTDLIKQGKAVLVMDPFLIGEHHSPFETRERVNVGGFMDTFEPTDTALRVQDVLTAYGWLLSRRDLTPHVSLVGMGDGIVWTMLAAGIEPSFHRLVLDQKLDTIDDDTLWATRFYIPSIRTIGDLEGAQRVYGKNKISILLPENFQQIVKALNR